MRETMNIADELDAQFITMNKVANEFLSMTDRISNMCDYKETDSTAVRKLKQEMYFVLSDGLNRVRTLFPVRKEVQ